MNDISSGFSAFRVHDAGDELRAGVESVSLADLAAGEVVIRAAYSSVNYKDALAATGRGKILRRFPIVAGIDVSGTVESSADDRFQAGDSVLVTGFELGVSHDGGYAEYCRVPADWVVPIPDGMDARTAMGLGTAGFTAALCIDRMEHNGVSPGSGPVVVTGASGGVGSIGIDMLAARGYEVVAVTGKATEHDFLQALGASEILDRSRIQLDGPPLEKGRWAGAIDNVGGDYLGWLTRTTKPGGSIASVGLAAGSHLKTTVMPFILRGVNLLGITSSGCPAGWRAPLWQRMATDLAPKHLEQIVTREVGLEDLPDVFDAMLAGNARGRTIVKI
ncbi:MAG: oxidoreductase [Thiotrichales bacterium]|nr:oxidoreductase [Thiotrichales bacterium]